MGSQDMPVGSPNLGAEKQWASVPFLLPPGSGHVLFAERSEACSQLSASLWKRSAASALGLIRGQEGLCHVEPYIKISYVDTEGRRLPEPHTLSAAPSREGENVFGVWTLCPCGQLAGGGLCVWVFLLMPSSSPSPDLQGSQAWLGKGRGSLGLRGDFFRDLGGERESTRDGANHSCGWVEGSSHRTSQSFDPVVAQALIDNLGQQRVSCSFKRDELWAVI